MSIANKKLIFFSIIGLFLITSLPVFAQQSFEDIVDSSLIDLNNREIITAISGLISKPTENKSRLDQYTGPSTHTNLIRYGTSAQNNIFAIINSLKRIDALLEKSKLTEKEAQQLVTFAEQSQKALSAAVSDLENYSRTMSLASQRLGNPGFFSPIKKRVKSSLDDGVRELNNRIIGLRNTERLVNQSIQRGDHKKIAANLLIKPPSIPTPDEKIKADLIKQIEERQEKIKEHLRKEGFILGEDIGKTPGPAEMIPNIIIPPDLTPAQKEALKRIIEKRQPAKSQIDKYIEERIDINIDNIEMTKKFFEGGDPPPFYQVMISNFETLKRNLEKCLTKEGDLEKIECTEAQYKKLIGVLEGVDIDKIPTDLSTYLSTYIDDLKEKTKEMEQIKVNLGVEPSPKVISAPAPVSTPTPKIIIYTDDKFCGPCKGLKKILIKMAGLKENATIEELREKLKNVVDIRSVRLFPGANYEDDYPKINAEDIPGLTGLPALFKDGKPILNEDNEPLIGSQITDEIRREMERATQSTPTPR